MYRTLRAKLLIFFLLTTLLPLLLIGFISYQSQKVELTNQLEQSLIFHADSLAVEIEHYLMERLMDVRYLASNPILKNEHATPVEIKKQLERFIRVHDVYYDGIFLNKEGIITAAMNDELVGNDLSNRDWFKVTEKGVFAFSDIYLSPIVNRPMLVMGGPVYSNSGVIVGYVSPSFNLQYLWRTFENFADQQERAGLDGYAFLMNKKGEIIAHPDQTEIFTSNFIEEYGLPELDIFEKSTNKEIFYNRADREVLSFSRISKNEGFENDWYIAISVPEDKLFAPLNELLKKYLLVIGVIVAISIVAVLKLSNYIVKPVKKLVAATSDFSTGKKNLELLDSYEEINRLNSTFMTMIDKLEEREKSHKKSTLVLETTDNGVIAVEKNTLTVTLFNRTCEHLFHMKKEQVLGKTIAELIEKSERFHQFISKTAVFDHKGEMSKKSELQCMMDGKMYYFLASISALPSLEGEKEAGEILLVFSNLTEKRQIEYELLHSEKLKAVGEMAAGLAHEIRNPLAIIRGFIQLFNQEKVNGKHEYNEIILHEIDRVNHFVTELLNVAKPRLVSDEKETCIVTLIEDLLALQKAQFSSKKIIVENQLKNISRTVIDAYKLQQVLINLIQNAVEAMGKNGGTLTIGTTECSATKSLTIFVRDTGCGMDKDTLQKIGTPFYTTKSTGTGLGLATCYRIIDEMGGTLKIHSEVGFGSSFSISLPIRSS